MEEVTDDEDYKEDDEIISIESNSLAVESMLDDDFETTNPLVIFGKDHHWFETGCRGFRRVMDVATEYTCDRYTQASRRSPSTIPNSDV